MKHFISLFLIFGISFIGLAQEITVQTQKPTPTPAAQTVKPKPKVKSKAKSQAKVASKAKPKTKAKITTKPKAKIATIEAATKDGKPVILKSNGTWEYTKDKPVAKEVQKPKETQKPVVKETPKPVVKEIKKPVVKETPKPVVKETQKAVVKPTPKPKPVAKTTPTPKPVVKSTPVPSPAKCGLTMDNAPAIRGLRLGMSRSEANLLIPGDRVKVLNSPTIIAYPQYSRVRGFENVYQITAHFFDDTLSDFTIEYDSDAKKWKNAKEFAQNLSANLNLPYKYWKFNPKNAAASEMQCSDFSITLDSSSNEITLEDLGVKEKTPQYNSLRKEVFKP